MIDKKIQNVILAVSLVALMVTTAFISYKTYHPSLPKKNVPPSGSIQSDLNDGLDSRGPGFTILWFTDFNHNRIIGFAPDGKVVWSQNMSADPISRSSWYHIGGIEYVTLAPNGNLIAIHGDGMMVQEIDRQNHNLVWQYGRAGIQTYRGGVLDEPDKAYKLNDREVVINSGNDRQVKIVDQSTNEVVWEYGEYHKMGSIPGLLRGNTSVRPLDNGKEILITDTLDKKIMVIDRATKNIVWEWKKPDAEWLQHAFPTKDGTFVLEDRLRGEVFEVNRQGQILWILSKLSDENRLSYPTDTAKLANGNVLIAEAGKSRIVEVVPQTGEVVREYVVHGLVTTIALDQKNIDGSRPNFIDNNIAENKKIIVADAGVAMKGGALPSNVGSETISGKVEDINASTARAGSIAIKNGQGSYAVQVYNYSGIVNKGGAPISLYGIGEGDIVTVTGTLSGEFIRARKVQNNSR